MNNILDELARFRENLIYGTGKGIRFDCGWCKFANEFARSSGNFYPVSLECVEE